MRHLYSLLLGLVIAPAVWVIAGLGQVKLTETAKNGLTLGSAAIPLALLAGSGLVFGLLAATRISPVGPLTAGGLLIAVQVAYVARAEQVTNVLPKALFGAEGVFTQPAVTGLGVLLGGGLLVALFSLTRWRAWPEDDSAGYTFLTDSGPVSSSTSTSKSKSSEDTTVSLASSKSTSSW